MRNRISSVLWVLAWTIGLAALGLLILESGGAATPVTPQNIDGYAQHSPMVQSIITVTNNNDSGIGSLRQAILGASYRGHDRLCTPCYWSHRTDERYADSYHKLDHTRPWAGPVGCQRQSRLAGVLAL